MYDSIYDEIYHEEDFSEPANEADDNYEQDCIDRAEDMREAFK